MTENFEQQSFIVRSIVQNKFEGILDKGTKDEEILEKTKKYVKSTLGKKLEELSGKHSNLSEQFVKHKEITTEELGYLKSQATQQQYELQLKENKLIDLKTELRKKKISEGLSKWQKPAYWLLLLGVAIIAFTVFQFCFKDSYYNLPYGIIRAIDTLESDTQKNTLRTLMYAPLVGLWLIGSFCWNRLGPTEKKEKKVIELGEDFDKTY